MDNPSTQQFDGAEFRRVLGHYPTGVCAVTAMSEDGPVGMVVGSFTSASLDPPLIAFFPDRRSTTWPKIKAVGRFCVNVLAANQNDVCRVLASKADNKFEQITYSQSATDVPVIDGSIAWIDCRLHSVHEAGDHYMVLGQVCAMRAESTHRPLLFFQGGYGEFLSFTAPA